MGGQALSDCSTPEMVQKPMAGFPIDELAAMCTLRKKEPNNDDYGNMEELDDAGTSFNTQPLQAVETGCWSYVSTRNNNFSNRSQKGTLCVDEGDYGVGTAGPNGGKITSTSATLEIPQGAVTAITTIQIESKPSSQNNIVSDVYKIEPVEFETATTDDNGNKATFQLTIPYSNRALAKQKVEHLNSEGKWVELTDSELQETTDSSGNTQTVAVAKISEGGEYRVVDSPNAGAIVAIVISGIVFLMTCGFLIYYRRYKMKPAEDDFSTVNH